MMIFRLILFFKVKIVGFKICVNKKNIFFQTLTFKKESPGVPMFF